MNTARRITSVFSAIVCFTAAAGAVPLAEAGGGPGKSLPGGSFACRAIQGGNNPTQVMQVTQGDLTQDLQFGHAAFLCESTVVSGSDLINGPDLLPTPAGTNSFTCYAVTPLGNSPNKSPKDPATLADSFGTEEADVAGFGIVCLPAKRD